MKKILIDGIVGSGKSHVCRLFSKLGIPIFYSDIKAKIILDSNSGTITRIKSEFGEGIYKNRVLDRMALANIVFNDKDKLAVLDSIVHPMVQEEFEFWCEMQEKFNICPYVIEESAIAIKHGIHKNFDYTIVVTADELTRINRVMLRDKCGENKVRERMKNQLSDEDIISQADFVITNDDFPNTECQVKAIHKIILDSIENYNLKQI